MKKFGRILICAIVLLSLVGCSFELNSKKLNVPTCDVYVTLKNGKINHHVIEGTTVPSDFLVRFGYMTAEKYAEMNAELDRGTTRDAEPNHDDINAEAWWNIKALNFEKVDEVATRAFAVIEESLEEVVFNDNEIDVIGVEAFTKAKGLKVVYLAEVKEIRERAFYEANSGQPHTEVTINSDEVKLGKFAFGGEKEELNPANITIYSDAEFEQEADDADLENVKNNNKVNVTFHIPTVQSDFRLGFEDETLEGLSVDNKQVVNSTPKFDEANEAAEEACTETGEKLVGYEFIGWQVLNAEGNYDLVTKENIKSLFENGLVEDTDFYALYKAKTFTLTIDSLSEGVEPVKVTFTFNGEVSTDLVKPSTQTLKDFENTQAPSKLISVKVVTSEAGADVKTYLDAPIFTYNYDTEAPENSKWSSDAVASYIAKRNSDDKLIWIYPGNITAEAIWEFNAGVKFTLIMPQVGDVCMELTPAELAAIGTVDEDNTIPTWTYDSTKVGQAQTVIGKFNEADGTYVGFFKLGTGFGGTALPTLTKDGYTFEGWLDTAKTSYKTIPSSVREDIVLNAILTKNKFVLKYNLNYDADPSLAITDKTIEFGDKSISLTSPKPRDGYSFIGWSIDNGTGKVDFSGKTLSYDSTEYADTSDIPTPPQANTLYKVNGVYYTYEDPAYVEFTKTPVIVGTTAYYDLGTITNTTYVDVDANGTWIYKGDKLSTDIVLYAKWSPNTYSFNYNKNANDNNITLDKTSEAINTGAVAPTLAVPTRVGYDFTGWYLETGCTTQYATDQGVIKPDVQVNSQTTIEGGVWKYTGAPFTLYAGWKQKDFTASFDSNGGFFTTTGGTLLEKKYTYGTGIASTADEWKVAVYGADGQTVTTNGVTKPNYSLTGWYMVDDSITEDTEGYTELKKADGSSLSKWGTKVTELTATDSGDKTIIAQWKPVTFTDGIKLYTHGGILDKSIVIPAEDPPQAGQIWTAVTEKDYQYKGNYTYGTGSTLPVNAADATPQIVKTGYDFCGWYVNENPILHDVAVEMGRLDLEESAITEVSSTDSGVIELHAVWAPKTITLTLDAVGGKLDESIVKPSSDTPTDDQIWTENTDKYTTTYSYDSSVVLPEVGTSDTQVIRSGYVFKGWYMVVDVTDTTNFAATIPEDGTYTGKAEAAYAGKIAYPLLDAEGNNIKKNPGGEDVATNWLYGIEIKSLTGKEFVDDTTLYAIWQDTPISIYVNDVLSDYKFMPRTGIVLNSSTSMNDTAKIAYDLDDLLTIFNMPSGAKKIFASVVVEGDDTYYDIFAKDGDIWYRNGEVIEPSSDPIDIGLTLDIDKYSLYLVGDSLGSAVITIYKDEAAYKNGSAYGTSEQYPQFNGALWNLPEFGFDGELYHVGWTIVDYGTNCSPLGGDDTTLTTFDYDATFVADAENAAGYVYPHDNSNKIKSFAVYGNWEDYNYEDFGDYGWYTAPSGNARLWYALYTSANYGSSSEPMYGNDQHYNTTKYGAKSGLNTSTVYQVSNSYSLGKKGYTFDGFSLHKMGFSNKSGWSINSTKKTMILTDKDGVVNGNAISASDNRTKGSVVTLVQPGDYIFVTEEIGKSSAFVDEYSPITYYVLFQPGYGDETVVGNIQLECTYDKPFAMPNCTYTREGYTFDHWEFVAINADSDYEIVPSGGTATEGKTDLAGISFGIGQDSDVNKNLVYKTKAQTETARDTVGEFEVVLKAVWKQRFGVSFHYNGGKQVSQAATLANNEKDTFDSTESAIYSLAVVEGEAYGKSGYFGKIGQTTYSGCLPNAKNGNSSLDGWYLPIGRPIDTAVPEGYNSGDVLREDGSYTLAKKASTDADVIAYPLYNGDKLSADYGKIMKDASNNDMYGIKITKDSIVGDFISATNSTLYAQWASYTKYDYNGATSGNTQAIKVIDLAGLYGTLPSPKLDNVLFLGWYQVVDVTNTTNFEATSPEDGTYTGKAEAAYAGKIAYPLYDKDGTHIKVNNAGEDKAENWMYGVLVTSKDVKPTEKTTLVAQWGYALLDSNNVLPIPATVAFTKQATKAGSAYGTLPVPSFENHVFAGWYRMIPITEEQYNQNYIEQQVEESFDYEYGSETIKVFKLYNANGALYEDCVGIPVNSKSLAVSNNEDRLIAQWNADCYITFDVSAKFTGQKTVYKLSYGSKLPSFVSLGIDTGSWKWVASEPINESCDFTDECTIDANWGNKVTLTLTEVSQE